MTLVIISTTYLLQKLSTFQIGNRKGPYLKRWQHCIEIVNHYQTYVTEVED